MWHKSHRFSFKSLTGRYKKVTLLAKHALDESRNILKTGSPSGNTDFLALVVALLSEDNQKIFFDDGKSVERFMTLHLFCRLSMG